MRNLSKFQKLSAMGTLIALLEIFQSACFKIIRDWRICWDLNIQKLKNLNMH